MKTTYPSDGVGQVKTAGQSGRLSGPIWSGWSGKEAAAALRRITEPLTGAQQMPDKRGGTTTIWVAHVNLTSEAIILGLILGFCLIVASYVVCAGLQDVAAAIDRHAASAVTETRSP